MDRNTKTPNTTVLTQITVDSSQVSRYENAFGYRMPAVMYDSLVAEYRKKQAKGSVQDYLCKFVNEQYGMLGYCIRVIRGV